MLEWRTGTFFSTLARLKSGVTVEQAEQVSSLLFRQLLQAEVDAGLPTGIRDDRPVEIHRIELPPAAAGFAGLRTAYADPLKVLLALVALVLLVACLNVAGLLLARGRIRHRESAIRLALGSGRFRICRQLLTESLLLAGLATGLGLLIARLFRQLLDPLTVGGSRVDLDLALNSRVLFFTGLCCVFTSLIFGSIPALNAARTRLIGALRTNAGGFREGRGANWGRLLVTTQLAASLLLLICASLLMRSLYELTLVEPGFEAERVLLMDLSFDLPSGNDAARRVLARRVPETLNRIPGVSASSIAWLGLFSSNDMSATLDVEGYSAEESEELAVRINVASPDYFRALGTPLLRGRSLAKSDTENSPHVAVVNKSFALRYWGSLNFSGKRFKLRGMEQAIEVVGIYQDFVWNDLRQDPTPMFFMSLQQLPMNPRSLAVRSTGDSNLLAAELKRELRKLDARVLFRDIKTLEDQVGRSLSREALLGKLTSVLGGLALFLGAVGLYGLMSFSVARRFREIGLRMALGASRSAVERLILRDVLILTSGGLALGLIVVFLTVCLLESYLFGLTVYDPPTFIGSILVLLGTAFLAGWLPARRAARLDPVQVLRFE